MRIFVCALLVNGAADHGSQLAFVDRLEQVCECALLDRFLRIMKVGIGRKKDDLALRKMLGAVPSNIQTRSSWHPDVGNDDIRPQLFQDGRAGHAIGAGRGDIAAQTGPVDQTDKALYDQFLIIQHNNGVGAHMFPFFGGLRGGLRLFNRAAEPKAVGSSDPAGA